MPAPLLLVLSHIRWDFIVQRPQQLMSRLAGRWRVLYVEEPVPCSGPARLEVHERGPQLAVLVPHTPFADTGAGFDDDAQRPLVQALLVDWLQQCGEKVDVAWLYTPRAEPLLQALAPRCIVYDCIDEPTARASEASRVAAHEAALLDEADLVLTGGPSLHAAKRQRNPRVYCMPGAVDATHFAPSSLDAQSEQAIEAQRLQSSTPHPRLGYFGVIDERLDFTLLAKLADQHPAWSLMMAGPVVGIDAHRLPQRPNLHWLGRQPYERLPYLVAGWDLCLLPFLHNAATRFINPTKTLEYMAAEKPVISTAIHDVVWLYGDAVALAREPEAFGDVCAAVLAESAAARCRRATEMLSIVSMYSWERSADCVHKMLVKVLGNGAGVASRQRGPIHTLATVPRGEGWIEGAAAVR